MAQTADGRRRLLDLAAGRKVKSPTDVVALTDSSGGTPDDTIAAVSGSGADSDINNNFADVTAKVNAIRQELEDLGILQ